jgi:hypothetical protein
MMLWKLNARQQKINKRNKHMKKYLLMASCFLMVNCSAQKGWKSLFDGKSLNGWKRLAGAATFSIENGEIVGTTVANTGNTFLATEKEYGDFILELDVKLESQQGNSGVQTRSHFDPAGKKGNGLVYGRQVEVDPSDRKWSGGIYDEGRRLWLYPLTLNPSAQNAYKADGYNHIKVECIGREMKTWFNGMPAAYLVDTIDEKGFIALQVHAVKPELAGKRVWFKNIRIKTSGLKPTPFPQGIYVVNHVPNTLLPFEKQNGWRLLFDGKTSNGWMSFKRTPFPANGWEIKNGTINVLTSEGKEAANGGDIVTKEQFSAFDLSFEFKLTPGANSGLKYFVTLAEPNHPGSALGLEYQVLDDAQHPDAKLGRNGNRTLASLYDLIASNKPSVTIRPIGQWNTGRIIVFPNNHVEHYLNGIKVLEYERGSKEFRESVALSKFKPVANFGEANEGYILLQDHGNAVSYRSIKIKLLND